jgi:hypothetical protein
MILKTKNNLASCLYFSILTELLLFSLKAGQAVEGFSGIDGEVTKVDFHQASQINVLETVFDAWLIEARNETCLRYTTDLNLFVSDKAMKYPGIIEPSKKLVVLFKEVS